LISAWVVAGLGSTAVSRAEPAAEAPIAIEDLDLAELLGGRVITASGGHEESAALASATLIVYTREQMRERGLRSLADVLAHTPGLHVIDDHTLPAVAVRGISGGLRAGSRLIKVMIDGVPVNFGPDLTAFLGSEYLPLEAIERVEIAKGPLSALYGANAFIATVNAITRRPEAGTHAELAGRVHLVRGRPGAGGSGLVSHRSGGVAALVAFGEDWIDRSGLRIERTFASQDPELPFYAPFFADASQDDISNPRSLFALVELERAELGRLTLEGGRQHLDSGAEFQPGSALTHRSRIALINSWLSARWTRPLRDTVRLFASAGAAQGEPTRDEILYLTANPRFSYTRNFAYARVDAAAGAEFQLLPVLRLTASADVAHEQQTVLYYTQRFHLQLGENAPGSTVDIISDSDRREVDQQTYGIQLQATHEPLQAVRLTADLRIEESNLMPLQYAWRLGAAWQFRRNMTARLILGRAYQSPSLVMLYGLPGSSQANVIGARTLFPPRALAPQHITSGELALYAQPLGFLVVEGSFYAQEVTDKIEFEQQNRDFFARNRGALRGLGLEASLRMSLGRFSPYLGGSAHLDFDQDEDGNYEHRDTPPELYPRVTVSGGLTVRAPELYCRGTAGLRWVSARGASQSNTYFNNGDPYSLPAYTTVDLTLASAGLRLVREAGETTVSLTVSNLLDERWFEPGFAGFDIPSRGRWLSLDLAQAF
jgi:iron complex outermembrane receptor protein